MVKIRRFFAKVFILVAIATVIAGGLAAFAVWHISQDLPEYQQLVDYYPATLTRVHANDGRVMAEFAHETVIAHSDPSPARDQVLRQAEVRHAPINIQIALPSLEGIKRAVEKKMGVALLPRRCAIEELQRKQLVAVRIPEVRYPRQLRLLYRKGELSHAAQAFLEVARK